MERFSAHLMAALLTACGGASDCPEPTTEAAESAGGETDEGTSPPGEVRTLASAETRSAPPGTATIQLLAQGRNAFVGRMVIEPGAGVPEHQDADEEYIHVLEGHGTIWIDGVEQEVTPGATIFMPAGATVRFENGDARMVALQVFAGPASAAKYDRWNPVPAEAAPAEETSGGVSDELIE